MYEIGFEITLFLLWKLLAGWVLLSIIVETLTFLDDGEGTFFQGKNLFGIDLEGLTRFEGEGKKVLLPWIAIPGEDYMSEEDYVTGWVVSALIALIAWAMSFFISAIWPIFIALIIMWIFFVLMRALIRTGKKKNKKINGEDVM